MKVLVFDIMLCKKNFFIKQTYFTREYGYKTNSDISYAE